MLLKFIENEIEHFTHSGDKAWFFGQKCLSGAYYRQAEFFESLKNSYTKQQKKTRSSKK